MRRDHLRIELRPAHCKYQILHAPFLEPHRLSAMGRKSLLSHELRNETLFRGVPRHRFGIGCRSLNPRRPQANILGTSPGLRRFQIRLCLRLVP